MNHISFTKPLRKSHTFCIFRSMVDFYSNLKWKLVQIHRWLFGYGELASSGLGHFVLTLLHVEKKAYWSLGRLRIAIKWVYWIIHGMTWFFAGCIKWHKHPILLSLSYSLKGLPHKFSLVVCFYFFLFSIVAICHFEKIQKKQSLGGRRLPPKSSFYVRMECLPFYSLVWKGELWAKDMG
jgi:hypothetical protein